MTIIQSRARYTQSCEEEHNQLDTVSGKRELYVSDLELYPLYADEMPRGTLVVPELRCVDGQLDSSQSRCANRIVHDT